MNIYTAVFLFLWCSEPTSSVGAVNIRGGATVDEEHQFAARVLKPTCTNGKSSFCGASGGGVKDMPCCDGLVCGSDGSCITAPTTPSPSPTPPPASCGRCVVDDQISCSAPTDCPTTSSQGTCSAKSTNSGNSCTNDSDCLPNSGKPANRGTCDGGSTTNTQCDTSLPCPVTSSPTFSPTKAPTTSPSSEPTKSPTAAPMTCPEQYCSATYARKLDVEKLLQLPSKGLRRDVVDCSTDPNYELVTLDTYTAPGTNDVLIELKGPADAAYALNLVIAAPHGGSLKPTYIDDRVGSGIVTSKDSYTLEMSLLTANSLIRDCVGTPYVIINNLHRSKLDANRDLAEATAGISTGLDEAADAWRAFHTFITTAQEYVKVKYGTTTVTDSNGSELTGVNGLFFDMHGYRGNNGSTNTAATTGWKDDVNIGGAPFSQWGYRLSDDPSLQTCPLDDLSDKGSFSQARWLPNQSYECLVRGPDSLGSRFDALLPNVPDISDLCGRGTPSSAYPSPYDLATDPIYCLNANASSDPCHYYSGGFDVELHERMGVDLSTDPPTLSGLYFNAVQLELPRCIRFGGDQIRSDSANALAQAIKGFLDDLYGPPP